MSKTTFIGLLLIIFLASIFVQTAASDTPIITILSPENKTYLSKEMSLQFDVEGSPILVGYELNSGGVKWFMIEGSQFAPVTKMDTVYSRNRPEFGEFGRSYFLLPKPSIYRSSEGFVLESLTNVSGQLTVVLGVVKNYFVEYAVKRSSLAVPRLGVGEDLGIFEDYIIYPVGFDIVNKSMEFAAAKKSGFTDLTGGRFEFNLEGVKTGDNILSVYAVDKSGETVSTNTGFNASEPVVFTVSGPKINILSPIEDSFVGENITLKFNVEEKPFLAGYKLDAGSTKWFLIKDNMIAPVLKRGILFPPFMDGLDGIIFIPGTDIKIGSINLNSGPSADFAIIQGGVVTKYIHRDSTTSPPLKIGVDLELLPTYIIIPTKIDSTQDYMNIALADVYDLTMHPNKTAFQFEIENLPPGNHSITVFAQATGSEESSAAVDFTVKSKSLILTNNIDIPAAEKLYKKLTNYSHVTVWNMPGTAPEGLLPLYEYEYIFLIGGPKAPTTGNNSSEYLTNEERDKLIQQKNSSGYWIKPSNHSTYFTDDYNTSNPEISSKFDRQNIVVIAGHTRNETLAATELFVKEGFDELFRQ